MGNSNSNNSNYSRSGGPSSLMSPRTAIQAGPVQGGLKKQYSFIRNEVIFNNNKFFFGNELL